MCLRQPTEGPASKSEVCSHLLWSQGGVGGGLEDGGSAPLVVDALHRGQWGPAHLLTDRRGWDEVTSGSDLFSADPLTQVRQMLVDISRSLQAPNMMFRMSLVPSRPAKSCFS